MAHNNELWLTRTQQVSRKFIEENQPHEFSLFDVFWESFSARLESLCPFAENDPIAESQQSLSEIYFAKENALDLVTPIVMATVAEAIRKANQENVSSTDLKSFVSRMAAGFGAEKELTASLARHLPALCLDAFKAKSTVNDAVIASAASAQYEIWTGGKIKTVESLEAYEKQKDRYLFWLDLDEKTHRSQSRQISQQAIKLLQYLVSHLGKPTSAQKVFQDVFDGSAGPLLETDQNAMEQQLSKLHLYCGKKFRHYLFGEKFKKGLGLKTSFADKYFLFSRLR